jgi:hypothetical protein
MSGTTITEPGPPLFDEARLAVAGFLARYSGPTRKSYVKRPAPVLRLVRLSRSGDLRHPTEWGQPHLERTIRARHPHLGKVIHFVYWVHPGPVDCHYVHPVFRETV